MSRRAFLGLGSNMGDRTRYLQEAIARLRAAQGVNFLRQSRVYETEPIGLVDQPRFLNMVVEVDIGEEMRARELLALIKQIEADVGRTKRERWGPREIDIDILLIEGEEVKEDDFEVPHPRMWERAFAVLPLAELAPDLKAPTGETAAELGERLQQEQGIHAAFHL